MDYIVMISNIYDWLYKFEGIDVNAIITAATGLFGVFIGSIISYNFNKKLSNNALKARIIIGRKNLIFSKLYKELIKIKKSLGSLPKECFYFELDTNVVDTSITNIKFRDGFYFKRNYYEKSSFIIWKEMMDDIRKTQIPKEVKEVMLKFEDTIVSYFLSIDAYEKNIKTNTNEFKNILKEKYNISSNYDLNGSVALDEAFSKENYIPEYFKDYKVEDNVALKLDLKNFIDKSFDQKMIGDIKNNFYEIKVSLNNSLKVLDKLIQKIVDEYEYGEIL